MPSPFGSPMEAVSKAIGDTGNSMSSILNIWNLTNGQSPNSAIGQMTQPGSGSMNAFQSPGGGDVSIHEGDTQIA